MSTPLLERIANGPLPMDFERESEIAELESLAAGGYVRVRFSWGPGNRYVATVTEITSTGEFAATSFGPPSSRPELEPERARRVRMIEHFVLIALVAFAGALAVARWGG